MILVENNFLARVIDKRKWEEHLMRNQPCGFDLVISVSYLGILNYL